MNTPQFDNIMLTDYRIKIPTIVLPLKKKIKKRLELELKYVNKTVRSEYDESVLGEDW